MLKDLSSRGSRGDAIRQKAGGLSKDAPCERLRHDGMGTAEYFERNGCLLGRRKTFRFAIRPGKGTCMSPGGCPVTSLQRMRESKHDKVGHNNRLTADCPERSARLPNVYHQNVYSVPVLNRTSKENHRHPNS